MTNEELFTSVLKGRNFVTPKVISFERKGDYVCEVSHGRMFSNHIVGVTVVNAVKKERAMEFDKSFTEATLNRALKKATEYINNLKIQET